jgi:hypothetical protein
MKPARAKAQKKNKKKKMKGKKRGRNHLKQNIGIIFKNTLDKTFNQIKKVK